MAATESHLLSVRKSLKKRRAKLKEEGWCVDCGFLRPEPGRTLCKECLESRRVREKARAQRMKAEAALAILKPSARREAGAE